MKRFNRHFALYLLVFVLAAASLSAQTTVQHPWRGVTYTYEHRDEPAEEIFWVVIDVAKRKAAVRVAPGGPDPDGPGKWQTTLMPTSKIAEREHFDIAVNGDFFAIPRGKDAEGEVAQKTYENGVPATVSGPAMTDGTVWAEAQVPRPILFIDEKGHLEMVQSRAAPEGAKQVIAGADFLVKDGKPLFDIETVYKPGEFRNINPRTAIGIDKEGKKLFLLVVDGRSEKSKGMTYSQLAAEMVKIGAYTAINLDGGGSSTLVLRDAKSELRVMNHPSDWKERPVANVLGVNMHRGKSKAGH